MIGRLIFPFAVVCALLMERAATYLLGSLPANPTLWWLWMEFRPLFRPAWNGIESFGFQSMLVQAGALLALACVSVVLATGKRGRFWSFLTNHIALLMVTSCAWLASIGQIASVGLHPIEFGTSIVLANMSWLALVLTAVGLVGCGLCHWSYLKLATAKRSADRTGQPVGQR